MSWFCEAHVNTFSLQSQNSQTVQSTPGLTKPQVDEAHGWTGHFVYSVYSRSHHIPSIDLANLAKFSLRTNCWLLSLPDFHAQMVKVAQLFGHVWMPSFANGLRMPEALEVFLHHPNYIDFINCISGRVDASSRSYVSTASKISSLAVGKIEKHGAIA